MPANARLHQLHCNPNGFAFDPSTGLTYTLNSCSLQLIRWLKEGCEEDKLADRVLAEYDTAPHVAQRDVEHFLSSLQAMKLL